MDGLGKRILAWIDAHPNAHAGYVDQFVECGERYGFDSPPTTGCLLALVRDAYSDPGLSCVTASYTCTDGYRFRVVGGHHHGSNFQTMSNKQHTTDATALVAALEAVL